MLEEIAVWSDDRRLFYSSLVVFHRRCYLSSLDRKLGRLADFGKRLPDEAM